LSIAGNVQVTVRLLPVPAASAGALGMFGGCSVGADDVGSPRLYIVPLGRLVGPAARYVDIFGAVPVGAACMW
jgi:hypothetical protein